MNSIELKKYLLDNHSKIEEILEDIGCHSIKKHFNRITSALPNGDNEESIQVMFNDYLGVKVWTRNDFEQLEDKDIFTLIKYINNCTFKEAYSLTCRICGFSTDIEYKPMSQSTSLQFLKKYKKTISNEFDTDNHIINEMALDEFIKAPVKAFIDDNINFYAQHFYDDRYDLNDNRVVFPIRDYEGNLISIKGRTLYKDYKERGIPKYLYYFSMKSRGTLYGFYENIEFIKVNNELIVFEAEKSVQQLFGYGYGNSVSISKKTISKNQLNKLLSLNKTIVLVFDKDVKIEDIYIECRKFKGLINVFYIYDCDDILEDKMSPTDKGKDVWDMLYNNYKFKYRGE